MRTHGEHLGVSFRGQGFTMKTLSFEYKLWKHGSNKTVYVDDMKELKKEIDIFNAE